MTRRRSFDGLSDAARLAIYRGSVSEAQMAETIREAVSWLGGRVWDVRDSRGLNVTDMPDLLCVVPRTDLVALLELKSQNREVTPGQRQALHLLSQCHRAASAVVRPVPLEPTEIDLDAALRLLTGEDRR